MSVFTPVTLDEARTFVAQYEIGDVIDFQNIAAGVENSNFFVTTNVGRYVLTIFEKIPREDLDFYMGLLTHLTGKQVACAVPLKARNGAVLQTLHGKPAAIVTRLNGNDMAHPTPQDCRAVGAALARMHAATRDFPLKMRNWRGLSWWRSYASSLRPHLAAEEKTLLESELSHQAKFDSLQLPRGVIHGDLFRDNILWDDHLDTHVPQMIDFYFACDEFLLFDIAITVNDWCLDLPAYPAARLSPPHVRAFLAGYASVRALTPAERAAWPNMLRAAAMRTWLGRLGYNYFPRDSELTHPKDHPFTARLLQHHIAYEAGNREMVESVVSAAA
jgi:homoserine kinase type II